MKTIKVILSLSVAAASLWVAGCSKKSPPLTGGSVIEGPAGPVTLKLKWIPGKKYVQHMSMNQTGLMTIPGKDQPTEQETILTEDFSVSVIKELPNGGVLLEMEITGQKVESKFAGTTQMAFDSAQDPSEDAKSPVGAVLRKIIGCHFQYELNPDGSVDKVTGIDEMVKKMSSSDKQAEVLAKGMMNEDTIKQLGMGVRGLPKEPVKVGDSWTANLEIPAGQVGKLKIDTKNTFTGWQQHEGHKCAVLEFTGDMSTIPGTSHGAMKITIEKGRLHGNVWFDPELGAMIDSSSDQTMTLKIIAQGKTLGSEMKQIVVIKLTDVEDLAKK